MGFPFAMFDYWRVIQIRFSKDGFRTFFCELSCAFIIFKMLTLCLFNIAMKHRPCYGCLFHDHILYTLKKWWFSMVRSVNSPGADAARWRKRTSTRPARAIDRWPSEARRRQGIRMAVGFCREVMRSLAIVYSELLWIIDHHNWILNEYWLNIDWILI